MTTLAIPTHGHRSLAARWLGQREVWVALLFVLSVVAVSIIKPQFLAYSNFYDLLTDVAPVAILAAAQTLVIVTGEIDISVGSLVGLTAAVMGLLCYGSHPMMPVLPAVCIAIGIALGIGVLNGLLVTLGRVPSIIVTLGMLTMLRGITLLMMHGTNIEGRPHSLEVLATGSLLGLPITAWIAAVFALLCCGGVYFTPLGRRIYAVGSNAKAAPLAGISITRIKLFVFALSGLSAGVAAVLLTPRNSLVQSNVGTGMELLVVTCVVVGGTSISGGKGTILGSLVAVLLLGLVPTVLTYINAPSDWRMAIQGAFILIAVLADHLVRGHAAEEAG